MSDPSNVTNESVPSGGAFKTQAASMAPGQLAVSSLSSDIVPSTSGPSEEGVTEARAHGISDEERNSTWTALWDAVKTYTGAWAISTKARYEWEKCEADPNTRSRLLNLADETYDHTKRTWESVKEAYGKCRLGYNPPSRVDISFRPWALLSFDRTVAPTWSQIKSAEKEVLDGDHYTQRDFLDKYRVIARASGSVQQDTKIDESANVSSEDASSMHTFARSSFASMVLDANRGEEAASSRLPAKE